MSLNFKWVNKRERNCDYQYIVLRKNFKIIKTLITIHHTNTSGIFKHTYKSCKLVILNMFEIFMIITFAHLKIPFWFIKFIKPFFMYPCFTSMVPGNVKLLKSLTLYSAKYQCDVYLNHRQKQYLTNFSFYSSRFILRLWLNLLHKKSKITTNVKLYKKTI